MNILLINPPLYGVDSEPRFPLGLGYIASVLRNDGHSIQIIDANAFKLTDDQIVKMASSNKFDAIGLTGLITQFKQVQRLASIIKKTNFKTPIVLGGGLASAAPEVILNKTGVDIVVVGEGERTASELFQVIENGGRLENVSGLVFKNDDTILNTGPRKPIGEVSSLPFPAWDLFPMERYFNKSVMCMPKRWISIITTRGCPYQCTFCFHGIFGHRYRARTAENVFKEIELLHQKYGVTGFVFEDDTFVLDKKRIYGLCHLITESKLKIYWMCNARIDLVDEELVKKMKKVGCVIISYGIESGNQTQLDKIKKGITVEQAYKVIDMTKKAGILTHGFIMIGTPGETIGTINDSINFCKRAGLQAEFTFLTPIPGSRIYQDAVDTKTMKVTKDDLVENWGSWLNEVLVNFTNLSNEKLIELKRIAEKEIIIEYCKKNIKYILRMIILEFKINGYFAVLNRLKRGMKVFVRAQKGLDLRGNPDSV
jgi:anaerobic magnesium-protoporphyrin IX monomethyl ester cyclase